MKAPVKLSLAIALALASGSAFALGLGTIQVKSGLNQPLDAEIPVITESAAEANALTVDLASNEDFERIGLSKARLSVSIDMSVGTNAKGQTVIKLTTKDPVREPLLDFLLVANWSKGKLLREYTVLLDPPVTAPAKSTATVAPVAEKPAAAAQPLAAPKPAPPPAKPPRPEPKPPAAAAAPKPAKPAPTPPPPPAAPKPAAQPAATGNDYGPVAQGETLSEIARATRPNEKTSIDQMMLALLKTNPKAFYQDNINALKRGAILRIPSGDDLKASGTMREAAEQVRNQNAAWTGKAPVAAPTLVARTGTSTKGETPPPAKPAAEAKPTKQERLALVPPGSSKTDSTTDRAGTAGGTGKENAEVKAELARTKEALTSREQEATELKSRVKQLEDISSKDQRLISMKDSEIADLQKKLKDLQAKSAAPAPATAAATAATKPAETPAKPAETKAAETAAAKPDQKITAKDIWGDMNAADKGATKPAAGAAATAPTPVTTPTATPPAPPASSESPPAAATAAASTSTPATATGSTPSPTETGTTPASTPAASSAEAPKPAVSATAPAKTTTAAKVAPLEPASEPFYKNQNVLLGGGAALLLVGLLALMRFMRKPKPTLAGIGEDEFAAAGADEEELRLRDALQQNPANTAASLELLRHYYARGDAAKFEAAAEAMHAHLAESSAPEWDEVLAMGSVLAPNHPLFSALAAEPLPAHEEPMQPAPEFEYPEHDTHPATVEDARTQIGTFDFEPAPVEPIHVEHEIQATPAPAAHDDSFDFDLPIRTEEEAPPAQAAPAHYEAEPVPAPAAVAERQDDIYVGEDAIGTKLDLAKAYLDMGDPEGAKSMLDEVMAEGNDTQRDEARKLLAEIR